MFKKGKIFFKWFFPANCKPIGHGVSSETSLASCAEIHGESWRYHENDDLAIDQSLVRSTYLNWLHWDFEALAVFVIAGDESGARNSLMPCNFIERNLKDEDDHDDHEQSNGSAWHHQLSRLGKFTPLMPEISLNPLSILVKDDGSCGITKGAQCLLHYMLLRSRCQGMRIKMISNTEQHDQPR